MAFHIQWSVEGEKQLSRKLIGLGGLLRDYTYPLTDSAEYLKGIYSKDVFETKGAVIGERWKRLSPYTVAQKARKGFPSDPLVATGAMQGSFRTLVSSNQAVIFNTAEYFKYHQSRAPRTTIPRRVMMKIHHDQRAEIVRFFQEHIQLTLARP
jgi:phage gpG-like protein